MTPLEPLPENRGGLALTAFQQTQCDCRRKSAVSAVTLRNAIMGPPKFTLALRFFSRVVHPDEISERLGWKPNARHVMGENRVAPNGKRIGGTYTRNYCSFRLATGPEEHLNDALARFTADLGSCKDLLSRIRAGDGCTEFYVGWRSTSNTGEVLACSLLLNLGELGIDLAIDVYSTEAFKPRLDRGEARKLPRV